MTVKYSAGSEDPYTPEFRDPNDTAVDAVGRGLHPEPYRNGDGSSIIGPRNMNREQEDPDMIRPPRTDSGTLPNMKWSFADSHMRIEVSSVVFGNMRIMYLQASRRADGPDRQLCGNYQRVLSLRASTCDWTRVQYASSTGTKRYIHCVAR